MKNFFIKNREPLIHILVWTIYIAQSALTYPSEYVNEYGFWNIALKQVLGILVFMILFYANYLYFIPRILTNKKYILFAFINFLLIIFGISLEYLRAFYLDWYFNADNFFYNDVSKYLPYYSFRMFFYLVLSIGAKFAVDWFKYQQKLKELEEEKKLAELEMLKYQISPHFLFNTLNNLYSLMLSNSPKSKDALIKFSDIMRYQLSEEIQQNKIPLDKEIEYIKNFIELQKLRIENPDNIKFEVIGEIKNKQIAPMLIIPFIENAFKHGKLSGQEMKFTIKIENGNLNFTSINTIDEKVKNGVSGIGINNVKKRLELLYKDKYNLELFTRESNFLVNLTLYGI